MGFKLTAVCGYIIHSVRMIFLKRVEQSPDLTGHQKVQFLVQEKVNHGWLAGIVRN